MPAFDTETVDGSPILICTSIGDVLEKPTFDTALELLLGMPRWTAYNLRYDWQAVLLLAGSWQLLWRMARLHTALYYPAPGSPLGDTIRLDWIPGKSATIRAYSRGKLERRSDLYDCAQHYHMSLDAAAEKYLGARKLDLSESGIEIDRLGEYFDTDRWPIVVDYCVRDAELTAALYEKVAQALDAIERRVSAESGDTIEPPLWTKPISGAYIAGRFWRTELHPPPTAANRAFERCYFGGRIETIQRGLVAPVYEADINSAYPAACAGLPSMRTVTTTLRRNRRGELAAHPDALMGCYHVRLRIPETEPLGPHPVEYSNVLIYPVGTWDARVDRWTYLLCERMGWIDAVWSAYEALPKPGREVVYPFARIPELYRLRQERPEWKLAIKLLLNGLYGKLAQRISRWEITEDIAEADRLEEGFLLTEKVEDGWLQNFLYASHITGAVRAQLFQAARPLAKNGALISMATDAIYSTESPDVPISDQLGDWHVDSWERGVFLMSGMYELENADGDGERKTKVRGFSVAKDWSLIEQMKQIASGPYIPIPVRVPGSMLWALRYARPVNEIGTYLRGLDVCSDVKRVWAVDADVPTLLQSSQTGQSPIIER
jgi:hypothetical protein